MQRYPKVAIILATHEGSAYRIGWIDYINATEGNHWQSAIDKQH